jgi:hypothetical protein
MFWIAKGCGVTQVVRAVVIHTKPVRIAQPYEPKAFLVVVFDYIANLSRDATA